MTPTSLLQTLGAAIVVFASTNIDDIFLLSVMFADPKLPPRAVVTGQFIGIAILVAASALAGLVAVVIPPGWTSLLGVVPLGLGVAKAVALFRARGKDDAEPSSDSGSDSDSAKRQGRGPVLAVVGVTLANGGDNLGVYIPLFAANRAIIAVYAVVFAVLTGVWCALGYKLVHNQVFGAKLRRYGHVVLPVVLIALGGHILYGARVLFGAGTAV